MAAHELRELLLADAAAVAPRLLGARLISRTADGRVVLRLTEVEAYGGADDPASHAFRGPTSRNRPMYAGPGLAYVYFSYGMHWCLNIVTGPPGVPCAILIRAGQVLEGSAVARRRRPGAADRDLARGPGRLTRALGVTGELDGIDLCTGVGPLSLSVARDTKRTESLSVGPRVGVSGAGAATPWRFFLTDEPSVSGFRPGRAG